MSSRYIVSGQGIDPQKQELAKRLRREMTHAEKILWSHIRGHRLGDLHFRRQQIIDGFIVDFYCHSVGLVIEVDGKVHESQVDYDIKRDKALQEHDLTVFRFRNDEILNSLSGVLDKILDFCRKRREL